MKPRLHKCPESKLWFITFIGVTECGLSPQQAYKQLQNKLRREHGYHLR